MRLIERGYAALPILPGTKRPGVEIGGFAAPFHEWSKSYDNGPPSENKLRYWSAGNTAVAVLGGYRGVLGIDIDTDDPAIKAAIEAILPYTKVGKRGGKGETLFFRGQGIASQSFSIGGNRIVDIIGSGRQTVIPPSIHPGTGRPYVWTREEALTDVAPDDLPAVPPNIVALISEALKPFGWEPPSPERIASDDADSPHRRLNDMAMANFGAWVPALGMYKCRPARGGYEAVATWRASSTGQANEKRKRNLKIHPSGIRDYGADQPYTPIDLVMASDGCDLDTAFHYLAERLNFSGALVIAFPTKPTAPAEPMPALETAAAGLEQFTHVPGVLGDITDWITATARRPNRVMALGAAISVVGTLIGRRVAGPTRSGTHLYIVPIAASGAGKQHPMDAIRTLLASAGAESHLTGPTRFFSISAVERHVAARPLSLVLLDEIGAFLRGVTASRASTHEAGISQVLRTAWGASFKVIETSHRAQEAAQVIRCPALSIYGASTPDEFYGALQGDSESNGFLNRFLTLDAGGRAPEVEPELDADTVPGSLGSALQALYEWSGPESLTCISDPTRPYTPDILPWASPAAHDCYRELSRTVEHYSDDNPEIGNSLKRTAETAVRLATIRAAGRWCYGAGIDLSDMEWAAQLAWAATFAMANKILDIVPKNERSEYARKIVSFVKRRGPVKVRDIQNQLRSAIKSPEIKAILGELVEMGSIETDGKEYR